MRRSFILNWQVTKVGHIKLIMFKNLLVIRGQYYQFNCLKSPIISRQWDKMVLSKSSRKSVIYMEIFLYDVDVIAPSCKTVSLFITSTGHHCYSQPDPPKFFLMLTPLKKLFLVAIKPLFNTFLNTHVFNQQVNFQNKALYHSGIFLNACNLSIFNSDNPRRTTQIVYQLKL